MKVAVVGSGISGLSAAWLLAKTPGFEVTLYESEGRPGGHSNTIDVHLEGKTYPVDTGFLVHNPITYPNLIALFKLLNVEVVDTEMTFSVRLIERNIEWAGNNLRTVFAQKKNLFSPGFWSMILGIIRFNREAQANLELAKKEKWSLGQLLEEKKFSREFRDWYLIPMGAAIWSTSTEEMLLFPAETFLQFCLNHSLLQVEGRPVWRTVKGGSREYVKKMVKDIHTVKLNSPVTRVERAEKVRVHSGTDVAEFDKIIFACHSDQTLAMLGDASAEEAAILKPARYQPNVAYLHTDEKLLPLDKSIWSAWNYISQIDSLNKREVCVSYLINNLQPLPFKTPVIVTLNPVQKPDADKIIKEIHYDHPVFDRPCLESQMSLHTIQGKNHSFFAGAWTRYGFHEDGLMSGMNVARMLGAKIPW